MGVREGGCAARARRARGPKRGGGEAAPGRGGGSEDQPSERSGAGGSSHSIDHAPWPKLRSPSDRRRPTTPPWQRIP